MQFTQVVVDLAPDMGDTSYVVAGWHTNTLEESEGLAYAGVQSGQTRWNISLTASFIGQQTPDALGTLAEAILQLLPLD